MSLREILAAWAQANCPRREVRASLLQALDQATPKSMTCTFMLGRLLTRNGKPFLVSCFGQELFAFELTEEQIAQLEVADEMLVCCETMHVRSHRRATDPVVTIESVALDNANSLDRSQPITGTLRYRSTHRLLKPLALRVAMEHPSFGSVTLFDYLHDLFPTQGEIKFKLGALGRIDGKDKNPSPRVLPLFFQFWTTKQFEPPHGGVPLGPSSPPFPHSTPFPPVAQRKTVPRSPSWAQPLLPMSSTFPPPYDPGPMAGFPDANEDPISDIRAVLVQID